jgi:hypothetical protein
MKGFKIVSKSAWNTLLNGHREAVSLLEFVSAMIALIAAKNFSFAKEKLASHPPNHLAAGLSGMIDTLAENAREEETRNWINEGRFKIAGVLSHGHEDITLLTEELIREIARYCNASQGAIFLINNEDPEDVFLEMKACYAYNRKKFLTKRFELTQGLTGQCFIEGEPIYLAKVPDGYIKITSGLGEALPKNVILLPLRDKHQKVGVLELAFFQQLHTSHRRFLEAICQDIAHGIISIRTGIHTQQLLHESKLATEQLRFSEKELHQNLEKMTSLQEELVRQNKVLNDTMQEVALKNAEIEHIRMQENEMIAAKLNTQQIIHDKIVERLKKRLETLQVESAMKQVNSFN